MGQRTIPPGFSMGLIKLITPNYFPTHAIEKYKLLLTVCFYISRNTTKCLSQLHNSLRTKLDIMQIPQYYETTLK